MTSPATAPLLIGLSGYATTGKDAAADALAADGYARAAFSDAICEMIYEINPHVHGTTRLADVVAELGWDGAEQLIEVQYLLARARMAVELPVSPGTDENGIRTLLAAMNPYIDGHLDLCTVVDAFGWLEAKKLTEIRELLQRGGGPEGGRKVLGEPVWIDTVLARSAGRATIITGLRFPDEVAAIENAGGIVIRVDRPGVGPANDHPTETALDGYPFTRRLTNDSTLEVLHQRIRALAYEDRMDDVAAASVESYLLAA